MQVLPTEWLSKKYIEVAETLAFSLNSFMSDYRSQFSMSLGIKKPIVLKNMTAETLNDQICKTCASAHHGLNAITKKSWQLPNRISTYYHMNECKKNNCP